MSVGARRGSDGPCQMSSSLRLEGGVQRPLVLQSQQMPEGEGHEEEGEGGRKREGD